MVAHPLQANPVPTAGLPARANILRGQSSRCVHTIFQDDDNSVLSLAASNKYLYSGSQSSMIHVWSLETFSFVTVLKGHRRSVLGLTLSEDERLLFSCSGDATVRVWDTERLVCIRLVQSIHDVGDIFSVAYSKLSNVVFFGSQNTSIQWMSLKEASRSSLGELDIPTSMRGCTNEQKPSFFVRSADEHDKDLEQLDKDLQKCVVREKNVCSNAHEGYVYCLLHSTSIPNVEGEVLISGSGDGHVKIWSVNNATLELLETLSGYPDKGVLCLALSDDGYLFCGVQGGSILVWDLETYQVIRTIAAHKVNGKVGRFLTLVSKDDVLALVFKDSELVSASADGTVKIWTQGFEFKECMDDHDGIVLALYTSDHYLVTGSSDHTIKFWDLGPSTGKGESLPRNASEYSTPANDALLSVLDQWVAMRTISGDPRYLEECRRGARYLKNVLQWLGGTSRMIPGASGCNPLVYGKFSGRRRAGESQAKLPTILIYGHYDVIAAENDKLQWQSDPFKLTGKNGYLYGRGVTDDKGPILACIFAVHELVKEGALDVDVIFLIEGEEEQGSTGLYEAIEKHEELFSGIDMILLSNSYWLGEDVPCLTYGLRGVVHASITVSNAHADLHSGVEGGAAPEPLVDMVHILSKLVDKNRVCIPGFYNEVRPVTPAEEKLYDPIIEWMQTTSSSEPSSCRSPHSSIGSPVLSSRQRAQKDTKETKEYLREQLMARWRYPTLTVHKVDVSINNPTIIPRQATATVSMRVVPDQSISEICRHFENYVYSVFSDRQSENTIKVEIQSSAEYWLGNPESDFFKQVEKAIEQEWNQKPLYIREGGSIPAVRWLERFCNAPVVHLPMGQASDQAHLHNERIRLRNLHAGRRIVKSLLRSLSSTPSTSAQ